EPALLETQLAAILRAGAHGPVRILLPMISVASEIRAVRRIMAKVVRRLRRRQIAIGDPLPEVGVMVEVPGAALAADSLARESEFFAIGTNDLTMYTLAIDRGDEQVADLYDPLHPGVLRLIQLTVDAANRRGIDVSVCGEMAGNPRHAPLLVGMGLRQLSMTPNSLPRVKQRIRQLDGAAAARRAQTILDQYDPERVSALLDEFIEAL
ncbi:MAG: putative PEP-binding protein, partial [Thalassobaculaceae bacterium]